MNFPIWLFGFVMGATGTLITVDLKPFGPYGAAREYERELKRRAESYIRLGMEPSDAKYRARNEMNKEANDVLNTK